MLNKLITSNVALLQAYAFAIHYARIRQQLPSSLKTIPKQSLAGALEEELLIFHIEFASVLGYNIAELVPCLLDHEREEVARLLATRPQLVSTPPKVAFEAA